MKKMIVSHFIHAVYFSLQPIGSTIQSFIGQIILDEGGWRRMSTQRKFCFLIMIGYLVTLLSLYQGSAQAQDPSEVERSTIANEYGKEVRKAQKILEQRTQKQIARLNKQLRALGRATEGRATNPERIDTLRKLVINTRNTLLRERLEELIKLFNNKRISQQTFNIIRVNLRRGLLGVPILFASFFADSVAEAVVLVNEFNREQSKLRPIVNALKFRDCKAIRSYNTLLNTGNFSNILSVRLSTQEEPELGDPLVERIRLAVTQAALECDLLDAVKDVALELSQKRQFSIDELKQPQAVDKLTINKFDIPKKQ